MDRFEESVDFEALEREIEIDRQVRLGSLMLDIDQGLKKLAATQASCNQALDELEALLTKIEQRRKTSADS